MLLNKVTSILDFDEIATTKAFGFKTVDEYYRFGSCVFDIPYIDIPLLLISALDGPIAHKELLPFREVKSNPNVILATTKFGGHLAWFKGGCNNLLPTKRWFREPTSEFLHALMKVSIY
jgi:predicted alpha/beta-fold hydrolase